jgi:hypothetical protein
MDGESSLKQRRARFEPKVSARLDLELLALGYDRLADQAARNASNNIVYEYDLDAIARGRSAVFISLVNEQTA